MVAVMAHVFSVVLPISMRTLVDLPPLPLSLVVAAENFMIITLFSKLGSLYGIYRAKLVHILIDVKLDTLSLVLKLEEVDL